MHIAQYRPGLETSTINGTSNNAFKGVKFQFYVFNDKNIAPSAENANDAIFGGNARKLIEYLLRSYNIIPIKHVYVVD